VRARAAVAAAADRAGRTRLTTLHSQAPLTLRPTAAAVYLAAGAAGPLGGDDLELSIVVGPGAELVLRTVAAAVVLPGAGGCPSRLTLRLSVAAGGRLTVLPEPTVVASNAVHQATTLAEVETGGTLLIREEVLLGRHGEPGGRYRGLLRADVGGVPLLRHQLDLDGALAGDRAPETTMGARATGTLLHIDPQWTDPDRRPAGSADAQVAAMPLAGPGLLVTALCDDALALRGLLDRHLGESGR
jgi:urease accessory protein